MAHLFDFTVKHVPGNKNGGADALSRRRYADGDGEEDQKVDDYFDAKLYSIQGSSTPRDPMARVYLQAGEYDGEDLTIGQYLQTLERPPNLTDDEFQKLRKKAHQRWVPLQTVQEAWNTPSASNQSASRA